MLRLCDTHCHLYLEQFEQDLDAVIGRAKISGVNKMLVPGIDGPSSLQAIKLSGEYPKIIFAAAGIHPNYSDKVGQDEILEIEKLLENNPGIKAIGEIGLDFYRTWASKDSQVFVFREMLRLASEYNLPICLHVREAEDDVLALLKPWYSTLIKQQHPLSSKPGVFHSFDGSLKIAKWALEHNFKLGINGTATFKKTQVIRDSLSEIGIENLILETDAPYLAPHPNRGKRNEPSNIKHIVENLSESLAVDINRLSEVTSQNAGILFNWAND